MDLLHNLRRSERLRLLHIGEVSSLREGLPVVGVEQIVSDTQSLSTQSVVTSTPLPIGVSRTVDLPITAMSIAMLKRCGCQYQRDRDSLLSSLSICERVFNEESGISVSIKQEECVADSFNFSIPIVPALDEIVQLLRVRIFGYDVPRLEDVLIIDEVARCKDIFVTRSELFGLINDWGAYECCTHWIVKEYVSSLFNDSAWGALLGSSRGELSIGAENHYLVLIRDPSAPSLTRFNRLLSRQNGCHGDTYTLLSSTSTIKELLVGR
jgi:hypothetical protein